MSSTGLDSSSVADFLKREIPSTLSWTGRFRLCLGVAVCLIVFWIVSGATGLPPVLYMGGCLLTQENPALAIAVVAMTMIICTLLTKFIVGDLLTGRDIQFDGGLIAVTAGMVSLIGRMGSVQYVLFKIPAPKAYIVMSVELVILYGLAISCWLILRRMSRQPASDTRPLGTKVLTTLTHAIFTMTCAVFLIAQSAATAQAVAAVCISTLVASMAAHLIVPASSSFWYWISPLCVGLLGYMMAYFDPTGTAIGYPDGTLGALARATPLAYVSAGTAGAIFGYWIACGWNQPDPAGGTSTAA